MFQGTTQILPSLAAGLVGFALVVGLSGVAQAKDLKLEDVDATVKEESATIQGAVQAASTAIQSGVTAEGTSIKTEVGAQHTATQGAIGAAQTAIQGTVQMESTSIKDEMSQQHDMLKTEHEDTQTAIADVKALVEALDGGGGAGAGPLCGAGTEGQRFVPDDPTTPTEVCDNTTGLYWEHSPSTAFFQWSTDPPADTNTPAKDHCTGLNLGNGQAYRLAEVKELISLVDYGVPNQATALNDPNGPFEDVQSAGYWSASPLAGGPPSAWNVNFSNGSVLGNGKVFDRRAWCVRGGQNGS